MKTAVYKVSDLEKHHREKLTNLQELDPDQTLELSRNILRYFDEMHYWKEAPKELNNQE